MTSQINPNDIDGAYPVAGQDNDSQGFRDNFTNTSTNFQYAADEITDLQNNAVLKAALTGTTLDNNMNGSLLYNFEASQVAGAVNPLGTTSGTVTLDWDNGSYQTLTTSGSVTLGFTNFPASGVAASIVLRITVASTAHTLTLPAAVSIGTANLQGYASNIITFSTTGTFIFEFTTVNGGSAISIVDLNRNRDPLYLPSSEDLAASAAASLGKTTSYFSTSTSETATLAAGVAGQIKVFAMYADSGDMVITVSNAGWKSSGSGTITFNDIGDACTLMYINAKWFAIGANGVAFA
ncbi:MAG: hypothetical protein EBU08_08405 [Micrococcales bacterium]|nr:hypothetical protein [Micrococcales bacterium]